ncbi:hypothetical protein HK405_014818 [Cladochytrium tenue]|nr:hypothetical protein HK405_014818 [Cladochytrium tenue]
MRSLTALAAAALVIAAAGTVVRAQYCDSTQSSEWGAITSIISANSYCTEAECSCDPRVGIYSPVPDLDYLPANCTSSFPDPRICYGSYYNGGTDPCKPTKNTVTGHNGTIINNQMVYIKDPTNFCINLPNPDSPYLQEWYYNVGKYPTIVQAEGFVRSYCTGDYIPTNAKTLPDGGVRSAHVVVNFTTEGARYIQISGILECDVLNVNCTQSSAGAYDDGGQYDSSTYSQCGKEPYSGPDPSSPNSLTPYSTFYNYVEKAGDGIYCMRICEGPDSSYNYGDKTSAAAMTYAPCDSSADTYGCTFWNANTGDGFDYIDVVAGTTTTFSVSLPSITSSSAATATASGSTASGSSSSSSKSSTNAAAPARQAAGLLAALLVAAAVALAF